MSQANVLSGRLEDFRLVELLQVIGYNANTGALHLHAEDGSSGIIYFDEGVLVSCVQLDTEALTLGHVLQQLDLVPSEAIEEAFALQKQDPLGKRIGERLIDLGALGDDQLEHALRTQTLWITRELALWDSGSYEFRPGETTGAEATSLRIDPQDVVMEAIRFEHEWQSLQPALPEGMRTHLAMAAEPPIEASLIFDVPDWRVITAATYHQTVRRMATALHEPEVMVARRVVPMVRQGYLITVGAAGGPGLPAEAEQMSMRGFDIYTLIIHMESQWLKKSSPEERLVALAEFINLTMSHLEEVCVLNGLALLPETLATLLARDGLDQVYDYRIKIARNRINIADFTHYCHRVFVASQRDQLASTQLFYDYVFNTLERALTATFKAINARVTSPEERAHHQEAWEAFFQTIREQGSSGN